LMRNSFAVWPKHGWWLKSGGDTINHDRPHRALSYQTPAIAYWGTTGQEPRTWHLFKVKVRKCGAHNWPWKVDRQLPRLRGRINEGQIEEAQETHHSENRPFQMTKEWGQVRAAHMT
jgi:hypothetical protein